MYIAFVFPGPNGLCGYDVSRTFTTTGHKIYIQFRNHVGYEEGGFTVYLTDFRSGISKLSSLSPVTRNLCLISPRYIYRHHAFLGGDSVGQCVSYRIALAK